MAIIAARSPDDRTEVARVYEELYGGAASGAALCPGALR